MGRPHAWAHGQRPKTFLPEGKVLPQVPCDRYWVHTTHNLPLAPHAPMAPSPLSCWPPPGCQASCQLAASEVSYSMVVIINN